MYGEDNLPKKRKIVDYIMIAGRYIPDLAREIIKANKEGFSLYGSSFFIGKYNAFYQAMVKYED